MIAEISLYLDVIEKVSGSRWLHDQVHRIRGADPRYEIGAIPGSEEIHPLAIAWYSAREELILSEVTGAISFSENILIMAALGKNLSSVSKKPGFIKQKNRLLNQSLFRNAAYEIAIAAGNTGVGNPVEFIAPGLKMSIPGGSVRVDCFVPKSNQENSVQALFRLPMIEVNKDEEYTAPAIAYLELDSGSFSQLVTGFEHYGEKIKTQLTGSAYNLLVITRKETLTRPGGLKLREESLTIINPAPRFGLPSGFKIYTPGDSSSIS